MIARKYLYSCAIGVCLAVVAPAVLGGGAVTSAMAAAELAEPALLQPVTGWAVSRVGDPNKVDGYCALARRFSNNIVVTIAQNKKLESSIAFDFQRATISEGQSYAVVIKAGKENREFEIQAVSASALVVKTGADAKFFDALAREQVLDLKVGNNAHKFSFVDFNSGMNQLQTCLGNNPQQALVTKEMNDQISRMKSELSQLQAENSKLVGALETERSSFRQDMEQRANQNEDVKALMDKMGELERNNTELMKKLQTEQNANVGLRGDLDKAATSVKRNEETDMTTRLAIEAAQRERDELRSMLEMEKSRRGEIEKLAAQKDGIEKQKGDLLGRISELEQQNASLGMMLDKEQQERTQIEEKFKAAGYSKDEYERLVHENKDLHKTVATLKENKDEAQRLMSENSSLQQTVQTLQQGQSGANEAAQLALEESRSEIERLRAERDSLVQMMEKERKDFNTHVNRQDGASQEVKEMSAKLAELEARNADLMRSLQEKADASSAQNAESAEQLALNNRQAGETREEVEKLKTMLAMERDERMRLARQLIEDGKSNKSESGDEFAKRIEQVEAENERLRIALKVAATESAPQVDTAQLEQARAQIEQKARQLELVSAERDELKSLLEAEKDRREKIASMLDQKKSVTEEKADLSGKLRALEARNMELARALEEAKKHKPAPVQVGEVVAKPPVDVPQGTLVGATSDRVSGRSANEVLGRIDGSNPAVAQVKTELEIALAERDQYRTLLEDERMRLREVQSLRSRIGSISGDQASLNDTIQKLQNEKVDLIRSLEYERARLDEIARAKGGQKMVDDASGDAAKVSALTAERNELRRLLEEERHRKEEVANLEKMVSDVSKGESDLNTKVKQLQTEKDELSSLLQKAQRDADAARSQTGEFAKGNKDLSGLPAGAQGAGDADRLHMLEQENRKLYSEMQALQARKSELDAMDAEISSLKAQNGMLREELNARKGGNAKAYADGDMVAHLRSTIDRLDMQNKNLSEALDLSRSREEKARRENPYREKLMAAESRIQDVLSENAILSRELEEIRTDAEKNLLSVDQNWDVKKAASRYQQAEREVQRLSEVLTQEREQHQREVQELEGKLFDPAIADAEQIKRLKEMEAEIARLKSAPQVQQDTAQMARLQAEVNALRAMQAAPTVPSEPRVVYQQAPAADSGEIARLRSQLDAERNDHAREVKALEDKLFDPAITEAEQLRKLHQMETELAALRASKGVPEPRVVYQTVQQDDNGEVARLKAQLQAERDSHQLEVRDLENKLFDPAITEAEQLKRLRAMEAEIARLKGEPYVPAVPVEDVASVKMDAGSTPSAQGQSSVQRLRQMVANGGGQVSMVEEGRVVAPESEYTVSSSINTAPDKIAAAPATEPMDPAEVGSAVAMTPIMDGPGETALATAASPATPQPMIYNQQQAAAAQVMPAPMAMAPQGGVQPVVPMAASMAQPAYAQPYGQQAVAQTVSYQPMPQGPDGQDIASLLVQAGIPMVSGFEKVSSVASPNFAAFRWDTGSVYGSAEKTVMTDQGQFQNLVEGYLRKTQSRCEGNFDKTTSGTTYSRQRPIVSYDIACVTNDMQGAGAALLFYAENGTFNVIAHEGDVESFDHAMSTRDQVANYLAR